MNEDLTPIVDFFFEAGMLTKTPRAGFNFLGTGAQSVAEHLTRTTYIGYALAMLDGKADVAKVMKMCLFHDFGGSPSDTRLSNPRLDGN